MEERQTFEEFFGFAKTPFGRDIPASELVSTPQWDQLAGRLRYVASNNLFGLFTGDTGTGKSTALRRLEAGLDKNHFRLLYVIDSALTPRNFYVETLHQLGYSPRFFRGDAKRQLMKALDEVSGTGQLPVIIVDEAHLLSREMLEEIRFLLNCKMDSKSACSLILAGQSELGRNLKLQVHQAIDERVDMRFHLEPMSQEETFIYIKRHLERVSCSHEIFTESAQKMIYDYSGGKARKINRVALLSLMAAASQKKQLIDDGLVKEVIVSELEL